MAVRNPAPEDGVAFQGTVYRDRARVVLASGANAALAAGAHRAPGTVEDPADAGYLSGMIDLVVGDGVRLAFILEPGATTPIAMLFEMVPVLGSDGKTVIAYIENPLDTASIALVEGTLQIGTLMVPVTGVGIGNGAVATWVYAHQITLTAGATGLAARSPGGNRIAHLDYKPAEGIRFLRVQTSQAATAKKILTLARRLRGDAQGN